MDTTQSIRPKLYKVFIKLPFPQGYTTLGYTTISPESFTLKTGETLKFYSDKDMHFPFLILPMKGMIVEFVTSAAFETIQDVMKISDEATKNHVKAYRESKKQEEQAKVGPEIKPLINPDSLIKFKSE